MHDWVTVLTLACCPVLHSYSLLLVVIYFQDLFMNRDTHSLD